MEDFINSIADLKVCFEKYKIERLFKFKSIDLHYLCYQEKLKAANNLQALKMSSIIQERLKIIEENEKLNKLKRSNLLNEEWKIKSQ